MKLTILGSTGFVGKVLLSKALEAGHEIRVLVRDLEKLGSLGVVSSMSSAMPRIPILSGRRVAGSEAILSTIAPPKRNPGNPLHYERAIKNIISAMETAGVMRLIHIGGAGYSVGEDEQWTIKRRFLRGSLLIFAKPILDAKWLEWQVLKNSPLDWTLIRPPVIVAIAPAGMLVADEKLLPEKTVNLQDLADFMIQQITSADWVRKSPLVSSCRNGKGNRK